MAQIPAAYGKESGFTLLELMIVVAVLGIIAAIAFPNYTRYVVKSNRSAAQSFMYSIANKQEQYILDARQYAADVPTLSLTVPAEVSRNYNITLTGVTVSPPAYQVTATPIGSQLSRDTECGTVTLNQAGTKGQSGTGSVSDCW